jgi:septum formation protein
MSRSHISTSQMAAVDAAAPARQHLPVCDWRSTHLSFPVRLVLASQSPRRRLLMEQRGLVHDAVHPGVDDALLERGRGISPGQWAVALAYLKACAGFDKDRATGPRLVIGADTVVVKGDQMIGQPRDAQDAERIIRLLQDGEHEVVTGVALVWREAAPEEARSLPLRRRLFLDRAHVRVGHIGDRRIADYIASGNWRGKAGAYNLSERLEAGWPIDYEGDAGTIMGLPVARLVDVLQDLGHTV